MHRRQFLLGTAALGVAGRAHAALVCGNPFPGQLGPMQQCNAGIPSDVAGVTAAAVDGQHMNQWCWAACIEMVLTYYGHRVPQERIVAETFGSIVNLPAQPMQLLMALNRLYVDQGGLSFRVVADSYTANPVTAAQDLAGGMPLILGSMGHAMVLTSLEYVRDAYGNGQVMNAIVRDPWPGRGRRSLTAQEWASTSFLARIRVG